MKSLLFCCLIGTFLATGMCIECEICWEMGQKCNGYTRTCAADEDTCVTFQAELISDPASVTFAAKTCGTSDACNVDYEELSLHPDIKLRAKQACCTGEECKTLPPLVIDPKVNGSNGLQCPGCFALTSTECIEYMVSCQGIENQCLSITKKDQGFIFKDMSLKACASESLCTLIKKRFWSSLAELEVDVKCTPALPQSSP